MADFLSSLGGFSIFRFPIDAKKEPEIEEAFERDILEYPGTIREFVPFFTGHPTAMSLKYTMLEQTEIKEILNFYAGQKGRTIPFWLSSFHSTFSFIANQNVGNTVIAMEDTMFYNIFLGHERIIIKLFNGDILTHKITNATVGDFPGQMKITISPALDRNILKDDIEFCGLLYFTRFETDDIIISYEHDSVASTILSVVELIKEYPA